MTGTEGRTEHGAGDSTEGTVVVDARGLRCPLPVIEAARAARDLPPGTELEVLATDPATALDVPAWCRMREQAYVGEETADDGVPRYVVRRLR